MNKIYTSQKVNPVRSANNAKVEWTQGTSILSVIIWLALGIIVIVGVIVF